MNNPGRPIASATELISSYLDKIMATYNFYNFLFIYLYIQVGIVCPANSWKASRGGARQKKKKHEQLK